MKFRKGVTLIELVISVAIIGILAVNTLTIFNIGLKNIMRAGSKTDLVNLASIKVDRKINNPIITDIDNDGIEDDLDVTIYEGVNLTVNGLLGIDNVIGKTIEVKVKSTNEDGNRVFIKSFVPNQLE